MDSTHDALKAVDAERAHQNVKWPSEKDLHPAKFVILIGMYTLQIHDRQVGQDSLKDDEEVKHIFRKIAALAVRAMEANGVRERA